MAVAVTHNSNGNNTSNATSLSVSHVSDGNPMLLMVAFNSNSIISSLSTPPTFNGVNFDKKITSRVVGSWTVEVWALESPASTTANIVVTASSTCLMFLSGYNLSGSIALTDLVDTDVKTATGSSTSPSVVVASRTGDLVLGLTLNATTSQTFTDLGGQTNLFTNTAANTAFHGSSSTAVGAASVTFGYTLGTSGLWDTIGLNIAVAGSTSAERLSNESAVVASKGANTERLSNLSAIVSNTGVNTERLSNLSAIVAVPIGTAPERVSNLNAVVANTGVHTLRLSNMHVIIARRPKVTTYTINGQYSGSGNFAPATGSGTLTITR